MAKDYPAATGLEVYRGNVNTWECDEMGHMNVRFYVAKCEEAIAILLAELGLSPAEQRRQRVREAMGPDAIAIFQGARNVTRSADTDYPFRQDSDFWYVTGFDHPNAVALVRTDGGPEYTLYVEPRDPAMETWTGYRPGTEGAVRDFGADEAVQLELDTKNVETLVVKVFEIDAFRYHVERQKAVDASINLDGVVANFEQTYEYAEPPIRRVRRSFDLPMLRNPGTYVVDFVGNGISSRAVIHKGGLHMVDRTSAAGQLVRVYDEQGRHQPDAVAWFGGREYAADDRGDILIPFSTDPGTKKLVLRRGARSSMASFRHRQESYALAGSAHLDREALIADNTATLVLRPQLRLAAHPISLKLLERPLLVVTATDNPTRTVANLRFAFKKNGGNLGESGCVGYLFGHRSEVTLQSPGAPINEDSLLESLLELEAEGYELVEGGAVVHGPFTALESLQDGLRLQGWNVSEWEHCWHPLTSVDINDGPTAAQCLKLLEALESLDDVRSVSCNLGEYSETT